MSELAASASRSPLRSASASGGAPSAEEAPGVAAWLSGRAVLVTGATGFLGQLLVEKLLRACPAVGAVYVLVREKRGETPQRRVDCIFEDPVMARVRHLRDKVVALVGDCGAERLGLSEDDRATLVARVSVVFHCAATVRFDSPLRVATHINVRGTDEVLRLARAMPQLSSFAHLSTMYAHCPRSHVDELAYPPKMGAQQLLALVDALDDAALDRVQNVILEPWPNTYTFTKAIAEELLTREGKGLPVCIVRPSMVIGTTSEPVPGWINNVNGPSGLVFGVGLGLLHVLHQVDANSPPDLIPADLVVNATIAAAWKTAHSQNGSLVPCKAEGQEIPIYNCVSSPRKPIDWDTFLILNEKHGMNYPSIHCIWYYFLFRIQNYVLYRLLRILVHLVPALICDTMLRCVGKKPMLWKAYTKIHKFIDLTDYFGNGSWIFTDTNVQWLWKEMKEEDKNVFPFNIENIEWEDNVKHLIVGLRVYFLKEPLTTIPEGVAKYRRLKFMHFTLVTVLSLLILHFLWWSVWTLWSCF